MALKTLESVLDLNTKTNMRDLAVRFGCFQAVDAATRLLSRYILTLELSWYILIVLSRYILTSLLWYWYILTLLSRYILTLL